MISNETFFNENSDFYSDNDGTKNNFVLDFISSKKNNYKKFLDIGGGSGFFAIRLKNIYNDMQIFVIDPSQKFLDNIRDKDVIKIKGFLPNHLNIPRSVKFDYILLSEVLHHITSFSIFESKSLVIESLLEVKNSLSDDGYIFVHELFYEGHLSPSFSRTMIFYLLKIQNSLKLKIPSKHFILGLSVCFYTRSELEEIFSICGLSIIQSYKSDWANNYYKKGLFLKNWGRIMYILKKQN